MCNSCSCLPELLLSRPLQACVFPGCCFFPFLLAKHSASGKAIPVGGGVMVFSCLFTHMNNTYSENPLGCEHMQVLPVRDFKSTEALMNVQLEKEGHDKTELEAET